MTPLHQPPKPLFQGFLWVLLLALSIPTLAQSPPPSARPGGTVPAEWAGRTVQEVRILSKDRPLSPEINSQILRLIRTREGEAFAVETVQADYQRIYGLRRFSTVEARIEPTTGDGVIVVFEVAEQNVVREIRFRGNEEIETKTLQDAINLKTGEAIEPFRLALATEAIERLYRDGNYPYTHATVDADELARNGVVLFNVIEGPRVRVRKIRVLGNQSFTDGRIKDQIKTKSWFPLFASGELDPDRLEQDVASIRQFYENHGFFDVRVGRRLVVSPNQKEAMVDFVVDEGQRYIVERVTLKGNASLPDATLRQDLKLTAGQFYNQELVQRDVRSMVRAYAPLGRIYAPHDPDPDYLRIREERFFRRQPGTVELVYSIAEGKPFRVGPILVRGNSKTQDKVILRELRIQPGQLYDSVEIQKAQDRLKATGLFRSVTITPIKPPNGEPIY